MIFALVQIEHHQLATQIDWIDHTLPFLEHMVPLPLALASLSPSSTPILGYSGTLGGLVTLEHRVSAASILLLLPPLLKATQVVWSLQNIE